MATIDLQTGFLQEPVIIRVDGRELFRSVVSTQRLTGLATSIDAATCGQGSVIEIELERSGLRSSFQVDRDNANIGISLESGHVRHIISEHPFGYA